MNDIDFPHVHADQSLAVAHERMGTSHVQVLPVVGHAEAHNFVGHCDSQRRCGVLRIRHNRVRYKLIPCPFGIEGDKAFGASLIVLSFCIGLGIVVGDERPLGRRCKRYMGCQDGELHNSGDKPLPDKTT